MIVIQRGVSAKGVPAARSLRRFVRAALKRPIRQPSDITLRIVSEAESRALNHRYRGKNKSTNVLAFPYQSRPLLRGDLVICASVVNREAREQHKLSSAHWAHMVVHGVLHLIGHDHIKSSDARVMEAKERAILARLSFPDPYLLA